MQLLYLSPHDLEPDPDGVREETGDVDSLADTIAEQGMLQPLGVVRMSEGRYRVVYGNRRRAAAIKLNLEKVPCILLDAEDQDTLLQQLIENVQREELNDMEKARAFARLRTRIAEMQGGRRSESDLDDAIGKAVGLTGRTVRRYLGLLELPHEVQLLIKRGDLNVTQAQHLRRIPNRSTQIELARAAVEDGMSAADLSRLASYFAANPNLTMETALQALEQGEPHAHARPVPDMTITGGPLDRTSIATAERAESENDLWDDEELAGGDAEEQGYLSVEEEFSEPSKNKRRVFRIRSLDHMVEETDRISRAYAEGDLVKWVQKDESASFKLRLLLKQLETLVQGLRGIAREKGWEGD